MNIFLPHSIILFYNYTFFRLTSKFCFYSEFLHFTYNSVDQADLVDEDHSEHAKEMDTTDLNYQVDSFAKDLSTIFMNVVNSGKVSDFRDIFQTMDEDNSGK